MYKRISKAISLVLVLVFCTVSLLACSRSSDSTSDIDMEKELDKLGKLNQVTLHFLLQGDKKKDAEMVLAEVAARSNLNINLNFEWFNNDYDKNLTLRLASDVPLDAFYVGKPDYYDNDYIRLANNGDLKDITGLFPQYAPNIYTKFTKDALSAIKIGGKIYTVPSLYPEALCQYVSVDYDLMQKYNTHPIKTFEDYEIYLKTIKENEKNIIPGTMNIDTELFARVYDYIVLDNAQNLVYKRDDPKMKLIPWEQTSEFRQVVSMLAGWQEKGYLRNVNDDPKIKDASRFGARPIFFEGLSKVITVDSEGIENKYDAYSFTLYDTKPYQRLNPVGNRIMNGAIAFSSKSNNVERALMFLDWIQSSQENYDLFMYGVKGKNYNLVGERISLPENYKYNENSYLGWFNSPFRNIDFERLTLDNSLPDDFNEAYTDFINTKTKYAPHEGFAPNYKDVQHEANERKQIFSREISYAFYNGTLKAKNIDIIIQKLKDAGTEKIVYELQKQLDDWIATNK